MRSESADRLAGVISERLKVQKATVEAAIASIDRKPVALGRFAAKVVATPDWPTTPLPGEVAFEIREALIAQGVPVEPVRCFTCDERRPIAYVTSGKPSCRPCGPVGMVTCAAGLHEKPPTSRHCKQCREADAVAVLVDAAEAIGADLELAQLAVEQAVPSYLERLSAAKWLEADHGLDSDDPGPDSVQRLRRFLVERGFGNMPQCACCGMERTLRYKGDEGRLCTPCFMDLGVEGCVVCRKVRRVAWRDPERKPWCGVCRRSHDDRIADCSVCGRRSPIAVNGVDGPIGACCYRTPEEQCIGCMETKPVWARRDEGTYCQSCFDQPIEQCVRCGQQRRLPKKAVRGRVGWCVPCCRTPLVPGDEGALVRGGPCVGCGREAKIQAYLPDGARCSTCYDTALERREACSECGGMRRVYFWPGRCATCLGIDLGPICGSCGVESRLYSNGRCVVCALSDRVEAEFETLGERAGALAERLKSTNSPKATLRWLDESKAWPHVRSMLESDEVPDHERLDRVPRTRNRRGQSNNRHDVEYARALLVSAGILPPRSALAVRFQQWADDAMAGVGSSSNRWIVRRFCQERLVPTVEHQEHRGKGTVGTVRWAQARLRSAIAVTDWLEPLGGMAALNRKLLDEWLAGSTARFNVRDFIRWAVRQGLVDLPLSAIPVRTTRSPSEAVDHDERATIAQRLLHETGLTASDRVAGLLVVLFGQHLSRIVRLTVSDVCSEPMRLHLGVDWLEIPDPMETHLESLVAERTLGTSMDDATWLFPGIKPGTHLSEDALSRRLAPLGIASRAMRNTAIFHLASTVQPHTLYRLLGLHPNTAVAWARVAGSVYAAYWSGITDEDLVSDDDELDETSEVDSESEILLDLGLLEEDQAFW